MLPGLASFVAGDALHISVAPFALPSGRTASAAAGDTLKLGLRGPGTLDLTCAPHDADAAGLWQLSATGAQTAALPAGAYAWVYTVTDAQGARATVSIGQVDVRPDITGAAAGYDSRTTAQIALEQAEAALASFKGSGGRVRTYTIAGRTITYDSAAELLQVVNYWRVRVQTEQRRQGGPDLSRLLVRFGRSS